MAYILEPRPPFNPPGGKECLVNTVHFCSLVPRLSLCVNEKLKGKPGKIYHVRNVVGRENLITSGRTNELAHALWILVSLRKLYSQQNGTRQHYATLPGSTASYGKHFQSVHSKIKLTYSLT